MTMTFTEDARPEVGARVSIASLSETYASASEREKLIGSLGTVENSMTKAGFVRVTLDNRDHAEHDLFIPGELAPALVPAGTIVQALRDGAVCIPIRAGDLAVCDGGGGVALLDDGSTWCMSSPPPLVEKAGFRIVPEDEQGPGEPRKPFAVGDRVRIKGESFSAGSKFAGMEAVVERGYVNAYGGDPLLKPQSERPDGFGLAPFYWFESDLEIVADEPQASEDGLPEGFAVGNLVRIIESPYASEEAQVGRTGTVRGLASRGHRGPIAVSLPGYYYDTLTFRPHELQVIDHDEEEATVEDEPLAEWERELLAGQYERKALYEVGQKVVVTGDVEGWGHGIPEGTVTTIKRDDVDMDGSYLVTTEEDKDHFVDEGDLRPVEASVFAVGDRVRVVKPAYFLSAGGTTRVPNDDRIATNTEATIESPSFFGDEDEWVVRYVNREGASDSTTVHVDCLALIGESPVEVAEPEVEVVTVEDGEGLDALGNGSVIELVNGGDLHVKSSGDWYRIGSFEYGTYNITTDREAIESGVIVRYAA